MNLLDIRTQAEQLISCFDTAKWADSMKRDIGEKRDANGELEIFCWISFFGLFDE